MLHTGLLGRYPARLRSALAFLEGFAAFLEAVPEAASQVRLGFAGEDEPVLAEIIERLGLGRCARFLGWLPHHETLKRMQEASVLILIKGELVPDDPSVSRSFQIPQKAYEYLGARRPILAVAPESECAEIIRDMNAGLVASPSRPQEIAEALVSLYEARDELDKRFRCDEDKLKELEYPMIVAQVAQVIDDAANG